MRNIAHELWAAIFYLQEIAAQLLSAISQGEEIADRLLEAILFTEIFFATRNLNR